jgi:hypothetical protein
MALLSSKYIGLKILFYFIKSFPIFRTIEITKKVLNSDFIIDLVS